MDGWMDEPAGNVLDNFSGDNLMTVVTCTFLFNLVFVYPLVNFSLRISLHYILFGQTKVTPAKHWLETLTMFGLSLAVGLTLKDVSLVVSINGYDFFELIW